MIQCGDKGGRERRKAVSSKARPRLPHATEEVLLSSKRGWLSSLWRKLIWLIAWPVALWRVTGGRLVRRLRPPQQDLPPFGFRYCECGKGLVRESEPVERKCKDCEERGSRVSAAPIEGMKFCGNCGMPNLPKDDPANVCEPCAEAMWQQHEPAPTAGLVSLQELREQGGDDAEPDPTPATLTWVPGEKDRPQRPSMEVPVPSTAEPPGVVRVVTVRTGKMCARCGRLPADERSDLCWQCEPVPASQPGPAPKLPPPPPRIPDVDHVQLPLARSRHRFNRTHLIGIIVMVLALTVFAVGTYLRNYAISLYGPSIEGIQMAHTSDRTHLSWGSGYYDLLVMFCPGGNTQYKLSSPEVKITHAGVSHCHGFSLRSSRTGKWLRFGSNSFPGHMAQLPEGTWVINTWSR